MESYSAFCDQNGLHPLDCLVEAASDTTSSSIDLAADKPIHCFHYKYIQDVVASMSALEELTISGSMLEQRALQAVLNGLGQRGNAKDRTTNVNLERLRIVDNPDFSRQALPTLCAILDTCVEPMNEPLGATLQRLEFVNVGLDAEALECIRLNLAENSLQNLEHFSVQRECFSNAEDCACLIDVALMCGRLTGLTLKSCEITNEGFAEILKGLRRSKRCLKYLRLEDNAISDIGSTEALTQLEGVHIEDISLARNCIKSTAALRFARVLCRSHTFTDVDLSNQKRSSINTEVLEVFAHYLSHPSCSLKTLNLSGMNVTDAGIISLGKGLSANSSVKRCVITSRCEISEAALKQFAEALVSNSTLLELELPSLGGGIRAAIVQILELNRKLDAIMQRQKSREERGSPKAISRKPKSQIKAKVSPRVVSGLSELYERAEEERSHFGSPLPQARRAEATPLSCEHSSHCKSMETLLRSSEKATKERDDRSELLQRIERLESRVHDLSSRESPEIKRLRSHLQVLESKLNAVSSSNCILQSLAESLVESMKELEDRVTWNAEQTGTEESILQSRAIQQLVDRAVACAKESMGSSSFTTHSKPNRSIEGNEDMLGKQVGNVVARMDLIQKSIVEERENNIRTLELLTARDF